MNAEQLSKALAARFLEEGNYEALGIPLGREQAFAVAAAADDALDEFFQPEEGFAGLAVQSVGYTKGVEQEEVVIYVTRGSQKALRALPNKVDGVPVAAHVMGKLRAGPAPAVSTSPPRYFFERQGRLACGSSCAPSRARTQRSTSARVF